LSQGEAASDAATEARLGRLRGRVAAALAAKGAKGKGKKRSKDDPPLPPNFLFYPVRSISGHMSHLDGRMSHGLTSHGGVTSRSVSAAPMIKLLRLLHTVSSRLDALAVKDKVGGGGGGGVRAAAAAAAVNGWC